jgi:hypothetical protein
MIWEYSTGLQKKKAKREEWFFKNWKKQQNRI